MAGDSEVLLDVVRELRSEVTALKRLVDRLGDGGSPPVEGRMECPIREAGDPLAEGATPEVPLTGVDVGENRVTTGGPPAGCDDSASADVDHGCDAGGAEEDYGRDGEDPGREPGETDAASRGPELPPAPQLDLLIGDSLARDSPLSRRVLSLAKGGNTASKEKECGEERLRRWVGQAKETGASLGEVFVWLGANDVYRAGGSAADLRAVARDVKDIVGVFRDVAPVVVLGPLPRYRFDRGLVWERTPAFALERTLCRELAAPGVRVVPLGRRLATAVGGRRRVLRGDYFAPDGVHLTTLGYGRVAYP